MNTLIISSSLSKNSKSFVLCKAVQKKLLAFKFNFSTPKNLRPGTNELKSSIK